MLEAQAAPWCSWVRNSASMVSSAAGGYTTTCPRPARRPGNTHTLSASLARAGVRVRGVLDNPAPDVALPILYATRVLGRICAGPHFFGSLDDFHCQATASNSPKKLMWFLHDAQGRDILHAIALTADSDMLVFKIFLLNGVSASVPKFSRTIAVNEDRNAS